MSRQKTGALLPATRFRQYLVYEIPWHQAGQHTDPYPVGQPPAAKTAAWPFSLSSTVQKITDENQKRKHSR